MGKGRLEAFSDGVIAIIITIMVLELKVPRGASLAALDPVMPAFLSYVLSFANVAIYWNNHHHLMHTVHRVTSGIMWANMVLLFFLSLIPFATGWMGQNDFAPTPTMLYGVLLLLCGMSYFVLQQFIIRSHGSHSPLAEALGADWKGKGVLVVYLAAIAAAARYPIVSLVLYALVAMIWVVPDRRIERLMSGASDGHR
jgi:uncharacterized membrane protein